MKKYTVTIELDVVEINVSARTKTEAKKKALQKLSKKNINSLIRRSWPSNRKEIYADERIYY